jgi:hypothetical protein
MKAKGASAHAEIDKLETMPVMVTLAHDFF